MILSGARGKLIAIDAKNKTIRILGRSVEEDYECESDFRLEKAKPFMNKHVDLELLNFLVIGVTSAEK